jgi:basic amino acid/polyamine antiporter, APA family
MIHSDSAGRTTGKRLASALGLFDAVAIGLGAIIGGGIFIVTGIVAGLAGAALVVSIVLAAVISFFTALSFIELTRWRPAEGSVYFYSRALLSPFAGFLAGWMWLISNIFTGAAVALGVAHYLIFLLPGVNPRWTAVLLCLGFTLLNWVGIKHSAQVNNILVGTKVVVLLLFVLVGAFHFNPVYFTPFFTSAGGVFKGAFFIFFAFAGFARVAIVAEEVKDARKIVPCSILLSLVLSALIYIAVSSVALGLVGSVRLAASKSPLAEAIQVVGRPALVYAVSLGGMLAMASVLLTSILGVSRMIFAMAREGDLPPFLGRLHAKYRTPQFAILIAGAGCALSSSLFDVTAVVAISTFATLFNYSLANASAVRLGAGRKARSRVFPGIGLLLCLFLMLFISKSLLAAGLICLLVGLVGYFAVKR